MMIVDDEQIIRESLSTLIDWERMGIEIVSVCRNGLEAYESVIDDYPDIILTDIQMPGYSGLNSPDMMSSAMPGRRCITVSGIISSSRVITMN